MVLKPDRKLRYTFTYFDRCNMRGSETASHRVLGKRLNQSQGENPRRKIGISTSVVKCSDCGLIYANPLPIPDSLLDHYSIDPEAYWSESYFIEDKDYFNLEVRTLKSMYPFNQGDRALDIGAGFGFGKCMKVLAREGFDVYGIEPSKQFHKEATERNDICPDRLTSGSLEDAQFSNDYFDFITFGAVLEHLYDPAASIRKSLDWLKRGGIIHIEVPSSDWAVGKLMNAFYRLQGLDYVSNISPMHEPFHLYEFTIKSFQKHAVKAGYEIVQHDYYVCNTYLPA